MWRRSRLVPLGGLALAAAFAAASPAQARRPRDRVEVAYTTEPIRIDGNDREWRDVAALHLDRRDQLIDTGRLDWQGPRDASAQVRLLYDENHLYLSVRLYDDGPLVQQPNETFESGDVIEVFFDCDLSDAQQEEAGFNEDDLQLMLLPYAKDRSWAVIDPAAMDTRGATRARGVARGFTGVEVARVALADGVLVEACIPLHNLPKLAPRTPEIGFNIAFGDKDPGGDTYNYLAWSAGGPPAASPANFGRLVFAGPAVLVPRPAEGGDLTRALSSWLPFLLPALVALALLFLARRVLRGPLAHRLRARRAVGLAAAALIVAGVLLPDLVVSLRARELRQRSTGIATWISERLPSMEAGSFGSLQGASRDEPLLGLLGGGRFRRPLEYEFTSLAEIAPPAMKRRPMAFPNAGFAIHRYGIPLGDEATRVHVAHAVRGDELILVVSEAAGPQDVPAQSGPRLRLELEGPGAGETVIVPVATVVEEWSGPPERTAFSGAIELPADVREIGIARLDGDDVRLEGISRVPRGRTGPGRPLFLGSVSRLGVPTDLQGPYPRAAATLIAPGTNWRVRLPEPVAGVETVWLLLVAVDGEGFRGTTDAAVVGQVRVRTRRKQKAAVFDLRHQVEVFAGEKNANPELQRLGAPGYAGLAYEWEDLDGTARITPGIAISLGAPDPVRELTIVNLGSYPFRLRSVVFAKPKPVPVAEPGDSPLVATGRSGEVRLSDAAVAGLAGASFFLFRDDELSATSERHAPASLKLPSETEATLQQGGLAHTRDVLLPGGGSFETYVPLRGDGWGDAVLAVVVRDAGLADFARRLDLLGLLLGSLGLPWLLVFLLEMLVPAGSLRVQLTGTVAFATVVPLVLLSVFLVNLLEHDQSEKDRNGLLQDLRLADGRIEEAKSALVAEARASAKQIADEARTRLEAVAAAGGRREPVVRKKLREILALARPEGWSEESFLAVEVKHPDEAGRVLRVLDRDESRMLGETPLGPESSLYLRWGKLFVGARADLEDPPSGFGVRSARGRVIDDAWLGTWVSRGMLCIFDLRGYPIAVGGASVDPAAREHFVRRQSLPGAMDEKVPLVERLRESPGPLVARLTGGGAEWLGAFSLLRDREDAPLALLATVDRPKEATLPLFFGSVGVRPFFIAVAGLLLVLVAFLTLTVTDRISRPIERLQHLARRLSRGDLDVEVAPVPGADEVANLNRAFGEMARELRERIVQQEQMNSAMSRLTAKLELESVVQEAARILLEASGAAKIALVLHDRESGQLQVFDETGERRRIASQGTLATLVQRADGPCNALPGADAAAGIVPGVACAGCELVLPMRVQERRCGAALLLFDQRKATALHLPFLQGLVGQIVSAIETARLYGLAIEDATTGLYVRRYFRRRLAQEADRSQRSGDLLSLIRLQVTGDLRARWGDAYLDAVLGRIGAELTAELPPHALAGRVGLAACEILLPGVAREEARRLGRRLRGVVSGVVQDAGDAGGFEVRLGVVCFPEDGRSASFLAGELDRRMAGSAARSSRPVAPPLVRRGRAVFRTPAMVRLLENLDKAAATDLSLLIEGETGVGKEVFVDLCHQQSARASGPLVKVNCAAIPEALLESELFGHERGAFTGANERKRGVFEQGHGGTLFLDEIGELPFEVQAKLLRVLQDHEFTRVGGEVSVRVDVRMVTATHRDLRAMIRDGRFREDLFYRLQGLRLHVPPLRQRREEIPALVECFRSAFGADGREFSAAAFDAMYRYGWPGNVRELENVVKRALVLATGRFIEPEDLDLGAGRPAMVAVQEAARAAPPGRDDGPVDRIFVLPGAVGQEAATDAAGRWDLLRRFFTDHPGEREVGITPRAYRALAGVSARTATRDLAAWVATGRLERRGKRRSVRYFAVSIGIETEA